MEMIGLKRNKISLKEKAGKPRTHKKRKKVKLSSRAIRSRLSENAPVPVSKIDAFLA